ncbi:hypothetical protein ACTWJ8_40535 (plasmid) [Streptomyces sp. SDT5-1]|uniref:hypothetical protein n=1 Tax=Streptomyces sp. SDT5-1 TaxID=3406418 RepID=UPI003FD444F3
MADDSDYEFPQDLLTAQRELTEAVAERDAFAQTLPWSLTKAEAIPRSGYTNFERPEVPEDTDEETLARYAALRARVVELSEFIICHRYWAELDGSDAVRARSRLKHHPDAQPSRSGQEHELASEQEQDAAQAA